jgi:hypothetical protein
MKKIVSAFILLTAASLQTYAQTDLQVHYDFGKNRHYVTTTVESFKADKWGNEYFFVDLDYDAKNSPTCAYMEISRCLNFWGGPFSAHVEYNGGLGLGYGINSAWLGGVDYSMHNADFSKTLNLKALFKDIKGKNSTPQFTTVWGLQLLNKKLTLSGFADLWWEKNTYEYLTNDIHPVFISEPQIWYNFTEHMSAGSEVEIASNFANVKGFKVCPTLAVKWNF